MSCVDKFVSACPLSFTEMSETVQNYGCLPTPYQIVSMKLHHNKTWACHNEPTKSCVGGLRFLKEYGFDNSVSKLLTEDDLWHLCCNNLTDDEVNQISRRAFIDNHEKI